MLSGFIRFMQRPVVGTVLKTLVLALVFVTALDIFVAEPFVVSGASMEPTYMPGDYLIIDRIIPKSHPLEKGDVIVFEYPLDPSQYFIKRIDALPGQTVDEQTGAVVPRPSDPQRALDATTSTMTLASDEYFVLGDNSAESSDSRIWGPLQQKFIVGRVILRVWPL